MFTEKDLEQIKNKGIEIKEIEKQLENFRKGFPYANLVAPATPGNGIKVYNDNEVNYLVDIYNKKAPGKKITKFVPASGAASRMFKALFAFKEKYQGTKEDIQELENDQSFNSPHYFLNNIEKLAVYEDLKEILQNHGIDIKKSIEAKDYKPILEFFLEDNGLGYANLPKGLLKFHQYDSFSRTSFEEHLVEGANYCADQDGNVYIHFTISPDHIAKFKEHLENVKPNYEKAFEVTYHISFSVQKPSTDTIAVDMDNKPFYEPDGKILFRPGGHGALIENLNDIDSDIIFIKNIDNVVPDRLKPETYKYKIAIGGLLIRLKEKTDHYLTILEKGDTKILPEVEEFAKNELNIHLDEAYNSLTLKEKADHLYKMLNRPMRICGMVKNEGEPGGGPFWVENSKGDVSLQIVEKSQIDMDDEEQKAIVSNSTHFNPVDIVCTTKDYNGNMFNLKDFIDPGTGFISIKSKNGKDLKALELPGLWNGAMADWITSFVEVPLITFNPVKTINDLLREQHLK